MRWRSGRRSDNVEDRRGAGGMGIPVGRTGSIGGLGLVIIIVLSLVFGFDPRALLQGGIPGVPSPGQQSDQPGQTPPANDEQAQFVSVILADTEDTWGKLFKQMGREYRAPTLVLFSNYAKSACGMAQSAMGPFYCPGDAKVYIDLSFYRDMKTRMGAPGDFAQAYVIAHEVGHHVQALLGIAQKVNQARSRASQAESNALSVRMELQADCFAGVWANNAHRSRQILERGDIEEGLNAASAIGDDRLQKQSQGYVVPESFTHGSSAQRVRWFKRGLESGDPNNCNTFGAASI